MSDAPEGWERPIYVLHEHDASNHHYDLRLEFDNVLKSWAVPKGPPEEEKHLAIQTDDHSLSYASFEGTIPEDQYGGGTVEIYDRGTFDTIDKQADKIVFRLHGEKLQGEYVLVTFREEDGKQMWLWTEAANMEKC